MRRSVFVLIAVILTAVGCRSQVPPQSHLVTITWTTPTPTSTWAGCGTGVNACTYIISALSVTAGTLSCPSSTGSNYTALNASSPVTGNTYTDTTNTGKTMCYVGQTVQGAAISTASAPTAVPVVVPGNPTAPPLNQPTTATATVPPLTTDELREQFALTLPLDMHLKVTAR
jgi:hypothetical protein